MLQLRSQQADRFLDRAMVSLVSREDGPPGAISVVQRGDARQVEGGQFGRGQLAFRHKGLKPRDVGRLQKGKKLGLLRGGQRGRAKWRDIQQPQAGGLVRQDGLRQQQGKLG